jgi:hypothetical protein
MHDALSLQWHSLSSSHSQPVFAGPGGQSAYRDCPHQGWLVHFLSECQAGAQEVNLTGKIFADTQREGAK